MAIKTILVFHGVSLAGRFAHEALPGDTIVDGDGHLLIVSNPPEGKCKVVNLYVDPATGKLTIEWDDVPV